MSLASVVDNAVKTPFAAMLHLRSPAGLLTLAVGPDADHTAAVERICTDQGPFDASVRVGPALAANPAVKSAGVGLVSVVVAELICVHTNEVAVNDTLADMVQLPGAPRTVQVCAITAAGAIETAINNAKPPDFIWTRAPP